MKKILLAGFAGLCVFGFLIVSANSSAVPYSSRQSLSLTDALLGDTTAPKPDTTKKEFSKLTFNNRTLADTTAPKPDTAKLVAYAR